MDKAIYVAMTGAKEVLRAQTANNHNLANVTTTGFRADLTAFMSRAVEGPGHASRAYATSSTVGWNDDIGAIVSTGRDLDVAVNGDGWLAVQGPDGREAYTRAGNLQVDVNGQLLTATGLPVLGDGGPIAVPPNTSLSIGADGSISIVPVGQGPETISTVARIKLVNPERQTLERGSDGLFHQSDGAEAAADAGVRLVTGALESSNVNAAGAMVNMIELSRQFEMQLKAIRTAEDDARAAATLLRLG
ncbi:MAG: flagellar basal-body rod protein FlgF [Steroidobacteraceae bacterium]|nr:flagellar basal-body rod protein FlgF [Nevskiaceae bacterium]MCP5339067.1 flagellar basal-body rod protein FlgF [Nevskiaceae bacterium]MCP5359976.1 flagellar basal-body rod protein FlgF [Nevskiaceae bacterium]MCP5472204.1 flagellar basal-body rod protein FlgF [Nevskiaceae bacterium]